ncbi:hypothetical protein Syun_012626 [Stephania yunnanensis]|uniref:Uncharacterized protein n=1 Tax=Stephania yunnanensis TaxID=152371 RepID=A0AAP0JZT1_9MAGN
MVCSSKVITDVCTNLIYRSQGAKRCGGGCPPSSHHSLEFRPEGCDGLGGGPIATPSHPIMGPLNGGPSGDDGPLPLTGDGYSRLSPTRLIPSVRLRIQSEEQKLTFSIGNYVAAVRKEILDETDRETSCTKQISTLIIESITYKVATVLDVILPISRNMSLEISLLAYLVYDDLHPLELSMCLSNVQEVQEHADYKDWKDRHEKEQKMGESLNGRVIDAKMGEGISSADMDRREGRP